MICLNVILAIEGVDYDIAITNTKISTGTLFDRPKNLDFEIEKNIDLI